MKKTNPEIAVATARIQARAVAVRLFIGLTLALVALYAAIALIPLFTPRDVLMHAISSKEFASARAQAASAIKHKGDESGTYFEYPVSGLVEVKGGVNAKGTDNGPEFEGENIHAAIRYDRLILLLGSVGVIVLTIRTLAPSLYRVPLDSSKVGKEDKREEVPIIGQPQPTNAIGLFGMEVKSAEQRAEVLFVRSTLLLGGGIIMAFIGVVIFYITLPEHGKDTPLQSYWPQTIRPTGVLIFIEAIAWFLRKRPSEAVLDANRVSDGGEVKLGGV